MSTERGIYGEIKKYIGEKKNVVQSWFNLKKIVGKSNT